MNKHIAIFIIAVLIVAIGFGGYYMAKTITGKATSESGNKVVLETNYGNIVIQMRSDMPITAGNFVGLAKKGKYDGVIFHRVIDGFMIQGGDPTGTGYGDRSIPMIPDEFEGVQENNRGTISMANAGPNTGSSQFFLNLVDNNFLDGKHPVFGDIVEGMDVIDKIAKVATDRADKPLKEVKILKAKVL